MAVQMRLRRVLRARIVCQPTGGLRESRLRAPGRVTAAMRSCPETMRPDTVTKVRIRSLAEAGDLPLEQDDGACRATPLQPYPFLLRTSNLDLSGLTLQIGCSTPLAVLGAVPTATAWLLLPLEGRSTLLLGGRIAETDGVAAFGAGADYEMANRADASWGLVAIPAAELVPLLSPPGGSPIRRPGAGAWLRADPGAWTRACMLMQDAAAVMEMDPGVFEVDEARRSLRAEVLGACYDLLAGPVEAAAPRRASSSLRRIVRTADDCLAAHPAQACDAAALAAAIGVSEAQLRSAFLAILGISTARYLLLRRLVMARTALLTPGHPRASVQETALALGFWNRRGFERAYRAMFGEAPPGC
jgi:AraC-like DNA-binding protein